MSKRKTQKVSARELETRFDAGDDLLPCLEVTKARRVRPRTKLLSVRLPEWLVSALNHEASRRGVAAEALLKVWAVERLQEESAK